MFKAPKTNILYTCYTKSRNGLNQFQNIARAQQQKQQLWKGGGDQGFWLDVSPKRAWAPPHNSFQWFTQIKRWKETQATQFVVAWTTATPPPTTPNPKRKQCIRPLFVLGVDCTSKRNLKKTWTKKKNRWNFHKLVLCVCFQQTEKKSHIDFLSSIFPYKIGNKKMLELTEQNVGILHETPYFKLKPSPRSVFGDIK